MIENGQQVSIEYTLKLDDGSTVDSNVGGDPLKYEQGSGQILPALEKMLAELSVDDSTDLVVSPEDGYGPVNPEAFERVDPDLIPAEAREVGTVLLAEDQQGNQRPIRIHEVSDDTIIIDLNHPLAGETLHFSVRILGIE